MKSGLEHGLSLKPFTRFAWGLTLTLLGLALWVAQAEAQYHKTPRISPRNRMVAPVTSPLLKRENPVVRQVQTDPRIHAEPPPPLEPGFVPVSGQPESIVKPTPVASPQPIAGKSAKTTESPKKPDRQAPKGHPLVIAPSGNESGESTVLPPARGKAVITAPVKAVQPVTTQSPSSKKSLNASEKPLVYFPEELTGASPKQMTHQKGFERGFYPAGYRPYLPAASVLKTGDHKAALSHYNRGSHYGHANQLDEAILEYQQAIRENPELADAYVGLSSAYLFKSYWEEVFLNANKALSLKEGFIDPANITQAQFNLSTAYCAAAEYRKAKRLHKKVKTAHHPQEGDLWRYIEKNCKP